MKLNGESLAGVDRNTRMYLFSKQDTYRGTSCVSVCGGGLRQNRTCPPLAVVPPPFSIAWWRRLPYHDTSNPFDTFNHHDKSAELFFPHNLQGGAKLHSHSITTLKQPI